MSPTGAFSACHYPLRQRWAPVVSSSRTGLLACNPRPGGTSKSVDRRRSPLLQRAFALQLCGARGCIVSVCAGSFAVTASGL